MKLIKKKPTSNGVRHAIRLEKSQLCKYNRIIKAKIKGFKKYSGRCAKTGTITVRHKGAGVKKNYRQIKFNNQKTNSIVITCNYDPYRNTFITLNFDLDKKVFFNNINVNNVFPGTLIGCFQKTKSLYLGCKTTFKNIPTGSIVSNFSKNLKFSQYARSAGTFAQIIQKDLINCKIKLPSNKIIKTSINNFAVLGINSNLLANKVVLGKAGVNRNNGKRPAVRGIAMNPVDHPHGGRTNGGRPSVTPWGKPALGQPTVKKLLNDKKK
jgi:large subunit ribosomal protein L2